MCEGGGSAEEGGDASVCAGPSWPKIRFVSCRVRMSGYRLECVDWVGWRVEHEHYRRRTEDRARGGQTPQRPPRSSVHNAVLAARPLRDARVARYLRSWPDLDPSIGVVLSKNLSKHV